MLQAGVLEMTWVMSDFTATNSSELSVSKGQQVEVVEVCQTRPDYCLVRMPTRGTDHDASSSVPEGLVPLAVLKQPPATSSSRGSPSSRRANPVATQALTERDIGKRNIKLRFLLRKLEIIAVNHRGVGR